MVDSHKKIFQHQAVLLNEAVDALVHDKNGFYVDATFGRGGHSQAILNQLSSSGRLLVIDKDVEAIKHAKALQKIDNRVLVWVGSFSEIKQALESIALSSFIDGILFDLGVSSPQLDDASRGFSFMHDGPLDMRMATNTGLTAEQWLNQVDEKLLATVLWQYGEERHSRRLASAIVEARQIKPITRTLELAKVIETAMPGRREKGKHPATRSFQAIRIYINNELDDLMTCLQNIPDILRPKGRLVTISFHSLEDRIVKRFIKQHSEPSRGPRGFPVEPDCSAITLRKIGKAIKPNQSELLNNVRSRSAVLRIAEKL